MVFRSHKDPDKLLRVHLEEVCRIACNNALYRNEIQIASLMHDFGKYTSYFQEYLDTGVETALSRHGFISAVAAAYISLKTVDDFSSALTLYSCVIHHHGNLRSSGHNLPRRRGMINRIHDANLMDKIKNAYMQLEDMKKNLDIICNDYNNFEYGQLIGEFIVNGKIEDILIKLKNIELKEKPDYIKHQFIYSRLIYADKISASNTILPAEKYVTYDRLNIARKKICSAESDINSIRTNIFKTVQETLMSDWSRSDIFTITAPTGTGKTYSGFFAALKLKELANMSGRIIYSLPFTSIINQNYNSLKKLFVDSGAREDNYILMHHHLGDIAYKSADSHNKLSYENEKEDYTVIQSQLLIESWNSGIIITTFVQLLETILGIRNKMLKKFHCIKNSIILIDEIQSIDIKYHKIIEELMKCTIKKLNCKIIMMTATKPVIFSEALELLPDHKGYYSMFNRTRLLIDLTPVTCDEFVNNFIKNYNKNKSYLIVCNTIRQSLDIYTKLSQIESFNNDVLFYLSTNIIPRQREKVICEVSEILRSENVQEKPILVSTQVVEAGVDMDFDEVYRDIAPLDSIIQCAGRCNRSGRETKEFYYGNVHIVNMVKDDKPERFASMIYRPNWLNLTVELLEDRKTIEEHEYLEIINKYFEAVKQCTSDVKYNKYKKAVSELDFDVIGEFSLIKEQGGYIDVFIIVDDEAEEVFKSFNNALNIKDIKKRQERLLRIRKEVLKNTISVPLKYRTRLESNTHMFYLPREACGENGIYSDNTGFKRTEDFDQFF
ncbi:MAG: CRISPR-associated helicase Cas3' [Clostridiaceae bacterium]|nr:CRISPR-associated helicase Cas3' [Clostridiaceae bacterium]